MNKGPAHADEPAAGAERPRTVVAAVAAMVGSALAAFGAAIALYGQRSWLTGQTIDAHSSSISDAVKSAVSSASSAHSSVSPASASASSSAVKEWPTTASGVHDSVSQQQQGALIGTIIVVAAIGILAASVYRGRHWSRWGVVAFWFLASFTGTLAGIGSVLSVGSGAPAAFKVPSFIAGALLAAAVILVNLKSSTAYFALSRPAPREGAPARRGLFAPRLPADARTSTKQPAAKPTSVSTSSAADGGEAHVQKQRAKKRAAASRESVARGAELARSRAKASKSRRIETDRRG
jgi:hypothetical protein